MNQRTRSQYLMSAFRTLAISAMLVLTTAFSLVPSKAEAALTIPVAVQNFNGTFAITGFATQTVAGVEKLVAVGTLTGTQKKGPKGALSPVAIGGITIPVTVVQGAACPILSLDLGPLHLDVLGLVIDLNEVVLDITAVPGALLGDLLCAVSHLLDNGGTLAQIAALLNDILDALG